MLPLATKGIYSGKIHIPRGIYVQNFYKWRRAYGEG